MLGFPSTLEKRIDDAAELGRAKATELDLKYETLIAAELKEIGKRVLPADVDFEHFDPEAVIRRSREGRESLNRLLEQMMLDAAKLGVETGGDLLGKVVSEHQRKAVSTITPSWELSNQTVEEWIRSRHWFTPSTLHGGLQQTEANRLRALLQNFTVNQQTQGWLRTQIQGPAGLYSRQRAETIARTEVTHAYARGNREAWGARGVSQVSWRTRVDEMVCSICGPLHDQNFPVDSDVIPPAHPGCRCWIVPFIDVADIPELPEQKPSAVASSARFQLPTEESDRAAEAVVKLMKIAKAEEKGTPVYLSRSRKFGKELGLEENDVMDSIFEPWSTTSNDTDYRSLTLQKRSEDLFGAELSSWQRQHLDDVADRRATMSRPFEGYMLPFEKALGDEQKALETTDKVLNLLYSDTQEMFAERGITHVTLYRGFVDDSLNAKTGEILEMGWANALESWSADPKIAFYFSDFDGVLVSASVPVERIVGTAVQGFGTLREKEVVVVGKLAKQASEVVKVLKGAREALPKGIIKDL